MADSESGLVLTPTGEKFLKEWVSEEYSIMAHTSGSTGTPKPIRLPKERMRQSARATNSFFGINSQSFMVCPLSAEYIAGKMMVVRALEAGCSLVMVEPSNRPLRGLNFDREITLVPIVPSMAASLKDTSLKIKHLIVGGAPMTAEQEREALKTAENVWATYGMTETCSHVALRRVGSNSREYIAIPGHQFSTDARDCLVIDGKLVTNDVVRLTSPTCFEWLGRYDDVIISGGIKIHPAEVETMLRPWIPADVEFFITGRASQVWGSEAVAVVIKGEISEKSFLEICSNSLSDRKLIPKAVIHAEPRYTASGKLIRRL